MQGDGLGCKSGGNENSNGPGRVPVIGNSDVDMLAVAVAQKTASWQMILAAH